MPDDEAIDLKLNQKRIIDLTGMGNAGFTWVYQVAPEGVIGISHEYLVAPNPKPGDRGIERFTVSAIEPGACSLVFRQIHSWEPDQPPFDVRKFQVRVS